MVMTNPPVDEHGDTDREADAMKDQLRKDIASQLNTIIGKDVVDDVYFVDFLIQ